jgi:hypothetical protein
MFLASSQLGQSLGAFPCNKGLQPKLYQGGFFLNARHLGRPINQVVFDIQCRSHKTTSSNDMPKYGTMMHISQGVLPIIPGSAAAVRRPLGWFVGCGPTINANLVF